MGVGVVTLIPALFSGKARVVLSMRKIFLGTGMLTGIAGHRFLPYRDAGLETFDKSAAVGTRG